VRVVTLHPDVLVATSRVYQTTCTAIRAGDEGFVVDSPIFPDELDALPGILAQAGWGLSGLLATHGDWDHLLARLAFPDVALGVAETTAARLRAEPGVAQRELRDADEDDYVVRGKPLSLGHVQALPVPGKLELGGDAELELIPTEGHTADGMAVWAPFAGVLVTGDYVSPVEIPMISEGGSRNAYVATLLRLAPYVEQAEWVVPGHGAAIDGARALAILREDIRYLESLGGVTGEAALPLARRDRVQKKIHAENLAQVGASS
jgi:glyoxylase-like metal-dependent hydrolase (beta-lactamase superfamily II)